MKTRAKISIAAVMLTATFIFQTQAQTDENPRVKLSVGPEVGLPVGSLNDRYDWSLGGSLQAEFPVYRHQLALTLNAGYYNLFTDNGGYVIGGTRYRDDLQVLPVKLGVKYFPVGGLYIQGETGAAFLLNKSDGGYDRGTAFTYAPQVGYRFNLDNGSFLDTGVKWEGNSKFGDGGSSNNFIGLRLAYGFSL